MIESFNVGDFAERLEDHPLVKAGEIHEVIETFRGGYLGFKRPIGGEWNPKGWRKVPRNCRACGTPIQIWPWGADCPACNPDPARG